MDGMRLVLAAACALLAGCYSTTSLLGDTSTDTTVETGVDTAFDFVPETLVDPGVEPEPPPPCPPPYPPPGGPAPYWEIDDWTTPPDGSLSLFCTVTEVAAGDDNSFTIFLTCYRPSGEFTDHSLYVRSEAPFWLYLSRGEEVVLDYAADHVWWVNRWFALRNARGGIIVAGVDAQRIGPDGMDPDDWYEPLGVQVVSGGWCPAEPTMCGPLERRGVQVEWGIITAEFVDRTYGTMGFMDSVQVHVGETHGYLEMECDDMPDEWVSALFVVAPEG
ncbi:MAG: hypothetical protein JRG91_21255 [Deltaproteobacteria bacterium]|nr:hypothetical protein [Deltaproteobacteria bacterium]